MKYNDTKSQEGKNDEKIKEWRKIGIAMSASWVVAASILVGAGIGYLLDRLLRTWPWFFIVMLVLGIGAGIYNLVKSLLKLQ
jgi:ATP synthase protein I